VCSRSRPRTSAQLADAHLPLYAQPRLAGDVRRRHRQGVSAGTVARYVARLSSSPVLAHPSLSSYADRHLGLVFPTASDLPPDSAYTLLPAADRHRLERHLRKSSEFFAHVICRFVLRDTGILLDKCASFFLSQVATKRARAQVETLMPSLALVLLQMSSAVEHGSRAIELRLHPGTSKIVAALSLSTSERLASGEMALLASPSPPPLGRVAAERRQRRALCAPAYRLGRASLIENGPASKARSRLTANLLAGEGFERTHLARRSRRSASVSSGPAASDRRLRLAGSTSQVRLQRLTLPLAGSRAVGGARRSTGEEESSGALSGLSRRVAATRARLMTYLHRPAAMARPVRGAETARARPETPVRRGSVRGELVRPSCGVRSSAFAFFLLLSSILCPT